MRRHLTFIFTRHTHQMTEELKSLLPTYIPLRSACEQTHLLRAICRVFDLTTLYPFMDALHEQAEQALVETEKKVTALKNEALKNQSLVPLDASHSLEDMFSRVALRLDDVTFYNFAPHGFLRKQCYVFSEDVQKLIEDAMEASLDRVFLNMSLEDGDDERVVHPSLPTFATLLALFPQSTRLQAVLEAGKEVMKREFCKRVDEWGK